MTLGSHARAALEGTLYLRTSELSRVNAPLVSMVAAIAAALDRPPATVDEMEAGFDLAPLDE
jgi:uncharacterized protein (DUF849 family)